MLQEKAVTPQTEASMGRIPWQRAGSGASRGSLRAAAAPQEGGVCGWWGICNSRPSTNLRFFFPTAKVGEHKGILENAVVTPSYTHTLICILNWVNYCVST